jgi:hypothetical protein
VSSSAPVNNLVCYYPKKGKEKELLALIEKHWPTLKAIGLATDLPAKIWKATDVNTGEKYFVEFFQWKNSEGADIAHQTPEVLAIWEPMVTVLNMDKFKIAEIEEIEE